MTAGDANTRLENAFLKLIEEKPFSKITVNDIVKEAGVHRNTFYYHYQSIPAMLSEICRRMTDRMFEIYQNVQSPADCILPLVKYSLSHRVAILHVFESDAKPILMDYVRRIGRFSIEQNRDQPERQADHDPLLHSRCGRCVDGMGGGRNRDGFLGGLCPDRQYPGADDAAGSRSHQPPVGRMIKRAGIRRC